MKLNTTKKRKTQSEDQSTIEVEKPLFSNYNNFAKKYYPYIPFTYYWALSRVVGREGKSLIDFGCGWGDPVAVLQSIKRRRAVGVDIFKNYIEIVKKRNIYGKLILADITKYRVKTKYDIVMCSHVLEHLPKNKVYSMLKYFETIANEKIVVALPVGHLTQDEYDGNKYQKHVSEWEPNDFRKLGYTVLGFSPRFLYHEDNAIKKLGIAGFLMFLVAYALEPFYINKPEKCVYMLAYKNFEKSKKQK